MCTLNMLERDTFETDEATLDTVTASTNAATRMADTNTFCKKCGHQEMQIPLKGKNGYCKACFLSTLTHKFRATLGKSKSVRPNDSVLIDHSGKANSTVLVHLVKADANESTSKRLRFRCKIVYIDDGIVKGLTLKERELIRNSLAKEAENLHLTMYVVPLTGCTTDILCEEIQSVNVLPGSTARNDAIVQGIFNSLESDTAKDELLQELRRKLLISAARKLNCNKVFVADTSVDLATKVLTDISTGRGSQLSVNVAFSDTRCTDIALLRPLRDFTEDDVVGYLECCELIPILASSTYNQLFSTSIRSTARNFIRRLDSEFHGTVSTIYRTSAKLATKMEEVHNTNACSREIDVIADVNDTCVLCELPLDSCYKEEGQLSVVQARIFSGLVSTVMDSSSNMILKSLNTYKPSKDEQSERVNDPKKKHCQCDSTAYTPLCEQPLQPETIEKYLCYGCRLIFINSNQKYNILPNFLLEKIQERLQITHLRKEITDFLI